MVWGGGAAVGLQADQRGVHQRAAGLRLRANKLRVMQGVVTQGMGRDRVPSSCRCARAVECKHRSCVGTSGKGEPPLLGRSPTVPV